MTAKDTAVTERDSRPQERGRSQRGAIEQVLSTSGAGVFLALVVLVVLMSFLSPYFLKPQNLFNVLRGMSTIGIMAIGQTMIIVTAGIDLSVGSVLAASGMATARLMYHGVDPWLSFAGGIALGLALGAINGFLITKAGINAFITTLGMLSVGRGLTYLLATGVRGTVASNVPMDSEAVNFLGAGYIGPVPFPVIEMAALVVIFSLFLRLTVLGRQIYATGSNLEAARLSGVHVDRVQLFAYTVTGGLSALAGIMEGGLLSTAATNAGTGKELDVIAAVVIGGASLVGGEGTIYGAIIGAAIMAVIRNAFVLLHLPIHMQTVTIGVVIVLAVGIDRLRKRS